ncbi:MAG: hypothetical protein ABDI19_06530, partial [Armatimonadota bacterium]
MLTYRLPVMLEGAGYGAAYRGRLFGLFALLAIGVMMAVRQRRLLGGAFWRAVLGIGIVALGSIALEGFMLPAGAWGAAGLFGIGFGLCFPAVHLLTYEGAAAHLRGTALALLYAFYSLGYVLGPISAGLSVGVLPPGGVGAFVASASVVGAILLAKKGVYSQS